ncbi:hypothetical protein Pelo_16091 [Pelomyxa schiedti]|nr:hypothetical protein Pelo_16091 [Pelomyxa schiedti]
MRDSFENSTANIYRPASLCDLAPQFHYINGKWLVVFYNTSKWEMEVTNLQDGSQLGEFSVLELPVPKGDWGNFTFQFNKFSPNEAVVYLRTSVVPIQGISMLHVIDLPQCFAAKSFSVLSSTKCPASCLNVTHLVLNRRNGARCFVFSDMSSILVIEEGTGVEQRLSGEGCEVSQLSVSTFCVTRGTLPTYEIWDCNNLTAPLRIILRPVVECRLFAEGGLIFVRTGSRFEVYVCGGTAPIVAFQPTKFWVNAQNHFSFLV